MRTLAKIFGTSFLIFLGWECSVAQVNNNNSNPNQVQVQTQPQSTNQQPSVLSPTSNIVDGAYKPEQHLNRRVVPPAQIREADAMWQTRIWRVIDTREKMNQQLYYPEQANGNRISLYELLYNALTGGEIKAYQFNPVDMDSYNLGVPLTKTEVLGQLISYDTIVDENGNRTPVKNKVTADKIRGYLVKEDWIFDRQRSVMDPRILFICPRIVTINQNTGKEDENAAPTSLFWVYFPEIRPLLAKTPVFNQENDAERRTFDDIFWKRQFSSYIVQQSNVFNRTIAAYLKGTDAILESGKIHNKIFGIEHDMWQY